MANWRQTRAHNTAYAYRCQLLKFLRELAPFGAPPIKLARISGPRPRSTVATPDELAKLLREPTPWLRLFMLLYFQCGLRRSEALRVTPRTWNPQTHTVTIKVKGGKERTAEVTDDVEALFRAAPPVDPDTSFINALHGRPVGPTAITVAWRRHQLRCGVNPKLTAHDLRRTAATILYHNTHDLRIAQQLLGHKNLTSTLSYLAPLAPDEARKYSELLRFEHFKSEVKQ